MRRRPEPFVLTRCAATFRWRRGGTRLRQALLGTIAWLVAGARAVLAQTEAPPPAPSATRSWYFEAVIVVAMIGLVLFVVCRSSRRN